MPYNYSNYKPSIVDVAVDTITFSGVGYGLEKLKATGKLRMTNIGAFLLADIFMRWTKWSPQFLNKESGQMGPAIWTAFLSAVMSIVFDMVGGYEQGAVLGAVVRNAVNIPFQIIIDKILAEK